MRYEDNEIFVNDDKHKLVLATLESERLTEELFTDINMALHMEAEVFDVRGWEPLETIEEQDLPLAPVILLPKRSK